MSRQDDQLQEKLQHIETELSAEAEKLSRVLAKIQKNWDDEQSFGQNTEKLG